MKALMVDGAKQNFIPLTQFRQAENLPPEFGVSLFEPKDTTGLGSIDGATEALIKIKDNLLAVVPSSVSMLNLLDEVEAITTAFRTELVAANVQIGLRPFEIDFAVSGFGDVLRSVAYKLIQLVHTHPEARQTLPETFDIETVYQAWLDDSARVSGTEHRYQVGDEEWFVRVVYNAYGRFGLRIEAPQATHYVYDAALACPASSYMFGLDQAVTRRLTEAFVAGLK